MLCLKPKWIHVKYKNAQVPFLDEYQKYINGSLMLVPCGKCLICKTRYAIEWAKRCVCQTNTSKNNHFLTLTYDDEHLPLTLKQVADDFTNLIKKMRKYKQFYKCKYLMVGEYGRKSGRLHAHALVWDFPIKTEYYGISKSNNPLYYSNQLNMKWGMGNITIGELNEATAFYCLKYSYKEINGMSVIKRQSQGIGKDWYYKNIDWAHHLTNNKYYNKLKNQILTASQKLANLKKSRKQYLDKNGYLQYFDKKQLEIDLDKSKAIIASKEKFDKRN